MNYTIFDKDSDYPITLTKQEIYQPFTALQDLLADTTLAQWQGWLDHLIIAVLRNNEWKTFGPPVYLYQATQKIIKLIEIVWFINHCFIDDYDTGYEKSALARQYTRGSFPRAFVKAPDDPDIVIDEGAYAVLATCLYESSLVSYRYTLNSWLSNALNASYMGNLNTEYLNNGSIEIKEYRLISQLIALAHSLKPHEFTAPGHQKRLLYQIFANNHIDYPYTLGYTEIEDPLSNLYYPFCYIHIERIPKIIYRWYEMLHSTDHWLYHNDPGNVYFIYETLLEIMETAWLIVQRNDYKSFVLNDSLSEGDAVLISELSAEDKIYPFRVIKRFFQIRSLRLWKHLLTEWLSGSLTDRKEDTLLETITTATCREVIQIVQVAYFIHKQYKNR